VWPALLLSMRFVRLLKVEVGIKRAECFVQERKVATQSLSCLADMLKRSRPWLQAMLPQNCLASVEYFYARTVCLKNFSTYFCLFFSFCVQFLCILLVPKAQIARYLICRKKLQKLDASLSLYAVIDLIYL
jgi:hypothetical protein